MALRLLGPGKACKYSFFATLTLLLLLIMGLTSSTLNATQVYSERISIIEVERHELSTTMESED
tara:strand:+ start:84 stop:275 length:192 start_codon:yes stop_codon:yes gene_type:complete